MENLVVLDVRRNGGPGSEFIPTPGYTPFEGDDKGRGR